MKQINEKTLRRLIKAVLREYWDDWREDDKAYEWKQEQEFLKKH